MYGLVDYMGFPDVSHQVGSADGVPSGAGQIHKKIADAGLKPDQLAIAQEAAPLVIQDQIADLKVPPVPR